MCGKHGADYDIKSSTIYQVANYVHPSPWTPALNQFHRWSTATNACLRSPNKSSASYVVPLQSDHPSRRRNSTGSRSWTSRREPASEIYTFHQTRMRGLLLHALENVCPWNLYEQFRSQAPSKPLQQMQAFGAVLPTLDTTADAYLENWTCVRQLLLNVNHMER